ncbi:MAG: O-antigen polysaccharide polymerase Wzy [Alphaproteobacteria bacterium]|nr:O-antigen polysaccharide polymerase Wzy [Alphaproteobacteria bacterium]
MAILFFMIAIAFVAGAFSIYVFYKKEGFYSTTFFFTIFSFLYFLALPLEMLANEYDDFTFGSFAHQVEKLNERIVLGDNYTNYRPTTFAAIRKLIPGYKNETNPLDDTYFLKLLSEKYKNQPDAFAAFLKDAKGNVRYKYHPLKFERPIAINNAFPNSTTASPSVYYKIYAMGVMAIIAFTIGYGLSGFKSHFPNQLNFKQLSKALSIRHKAFEISLFSLMIFLVLILAFFFSDFLTSIFKSYASMYNAKHGNPLPAFLYEVCYTLNAILAVFMIIRKKRLFFLIGSLMLAINIALGFLTFVKGPIVLAFLGMGYAYFFYIRNQKLAYLGVLLGVLFVVFIFLPLYTVLRHPVVGRDFDLARASFMENFQISFMNKEPVGPMGATIIAVREPLPLLLGSSYIDGLSLFIPRVLWQNRPLDIAESFARTHVPNWRPGEGMGFGAIAEAYINFGFYASFVEFLIFGFLWGWVWRCFQKATDFFSAPIYFDIIYRTVGFSIMMQFFRGFMMGAFKPLIMILVPISAALIGMQILLKMTRMSQRRFFSGKSAMDA